MRIGRVIGVMLLALAMVVLAGCGEKDKFAKVQTEVMQLNKQAAAVDVAEVPRSGDRKADGEKKLENIKKAKDEHAQIMNQIQNKITEMEGYVKSEPTLGPTLENVKAQVEQQNETFERVIKEDEWSANIRLKDPPPETEDPWVKASTWAK